MGEQGTILQRVDLRGMNEDDFDTSPIGRALSPIGAHGGGAVGKVAAAGWALLASAARWLVVPLMALVLVAGVRYGIREARRTTVPERPSTAVAPEQLPSRADSKPGRTVDPPSVDTLGPLSPTFSPARVHNPLPLSRTIPVGVSLLLLAAMLPLFRRTNGFIQDSSTFREALNRWYPLVHNVSPTPRSMKRFLNRVRFYAMRARNRFGADADWEAALVALAAVQHSHPEWLRDPAFWRNHVSYTRSHLAASGSALDLSLAGEDQYRDLEAFRHEFEELSSGIRTPGDERLDATEMPEPPPPVVTTLS